MKNEQQPYYEEETWTKGLTREQTLEKQIQQIAYNYSMALWDNFEYSLKALHPLLPKQVRAKFKPLKHDISPEGREDHFKQFIEIQAFIEEETNLIWKKKFIKTYE